MKRIKHYLLVFCIALVSCNSNSLKQKSAEKTIIEFLEANKLKSAGIEISPATLQQIGKTNIYSQFHTSVRADFKYKDDQSLTLLFDFKRTPKNKWFLKSVEGVDGPLKELSNWLEFNNKINIAVQ